MSRRYLFQKQLKDSDIPHKSMIANLHSYSQDFNFKYCLHHNLVIYFLSDSLFFRHSRIIFVFGKVVAFPLLVQSLLYEGRRIFVEIASVHAEDKHLEKLCHHGFVLDDEVDFTVGKD